MRAYNYFTLLSQYFRRNFSRVDFYFTIRLCVVVREHRLDSSFFSCATTDYAFKALRKLPFRKSTQCNTAAFNVMRKRAFGDKVTLINHK